MKENQILELWIGSIELSRMTEITALISTYKMPVCYCYCYCCKIVIYFLLNSERSGFVHLRQYYFGRFINIFEIVESFVMKKTAQQDFIA